MKSDAMLLCGRTVNVLSGARDAGELPWNPHPAFEGVALKHLVRGEDTQGALSCHLVRLEPGKGLAGHLHEGQWELHEVLAGSGEAGLAGQRLTYLPGVTTVVPRGVPHEVTAGPEGLIFFAKFFPALL